MHFRHFSEPPVIFIFIWSVYWYETYWQEGYNVSLYFPAMYWMQENCTTPVVYYFLSLALSLRPRKKIYSFASPPAPIFWICRKKFLFHNFFYFKLSDFFSQTQPKELSGNSKYSKLVFYPSQITLSMSICMETGLKWVSVGPREKNL